MQTMDFVGNGIVDLGLIGAFNTFRKGSKWFDRLTPNDEIEVRIPDTIGKGFTLTHAVVTHVECGDLDSMLARHATRNHAVLRGAPMYADNELGAMGGLFRLLCEIYPGTSFDDEFTVVGLARPSWTKEMHFVKAPEQTEWR